MGLLFVSCRLLHTDCCAVLVRNDCKNNETKTEAVLTFNSWIIHHKATEWCSIHCPTRVSHTCCLTHVSTYAHTITGALWISLIASDMLLVVTVYNTARDEWNRSTEQDEWHANWKRDESYGFWNFLLHFLIMHCLPIASRFGSACTLMKQINPLSIGWTQSGYCSGFSTWLRST